MGTRCLLLAGSGNSPSAEAGTAQAPMLLLPVLNAMFDITTTRTEAAGVHPPLITFAMLGALTLACSLFAGYDMVCCTPSPSPSSCR